jgi:hypothetical protein
LIRYHQTSDVFASANKSEEIMRTTLDLAEDVLLAAKEIARQRGITVGKVMSDLARQALMRESSGATKNGLPIFPIQPGAKIVTMELVKQLRDETP